MCNKKTLLNININYVYIIGSFCNAKPRSCSIPPLEHVLNNLFFRFALLFFEIAEIIVPVVRGIVRIIEIVIALVVAAVIVAMTVVEGKDGGRYGAGSSMNLHV